MGRVVVRAQELTCRGQGVPTASHRARYFEENSIAVSYLMTRRGARSLRSDGVTEDEDIAKMLDEW